MRSLTCTFLLLTLAACQTSPGPTTDTNSQTSAETGTSSDTGSSSGTILATETPTDPTDTTTLTATSTTTATTTAPIDPTTTEPTSESATDSAATTTTGDTTVADTTTSGDTTTGPDEGALTIYITDVELYADCMPEIDPDPVDGGWFVYFDNSLGASDTTATLVSATLSLADADPPMLEPIVVTPTESGVVPAGQEIDQNMSKQVGPKHSACDHCDEWYELILEYEENGQPRVATEDVKISCNF